ncbi:putative bifunctional diguanylate cyclase/phosphodiesterase [Aeromonas simiae]|uniref:putative bifunctional diguanylate cyclase/phosphodiesterase n=1 Tax=Aeromonas simiae TaxID=218936 RepID=UPI0005AB4C78|nr:bifunctional diguanylate cyclase/phosphodiesterase [Aeromonas simiae]
MPRSKFFGLLLMVAAFLGVTLWSAWNYERAFNAVTRYTQRSAWSLAQMELELRAFQGELALYRLGGSSPQALQRRFDIAWNRLDVFLHAKGVGQNEELLPIRKAVSDLLALLRRHEADVVAATPADPGLARLSQELDLRLDAVRKVTIQNFTGPSVVTPRVTLERVREQNFVVLGVLLLVTMAMLLTLFLEVRRQHFLAWNDSLTRLPNRVALMHFLRRHVARGGRRMTVCLFDLGHFREVNDSLGYEVGDALLCALAAKLHALRGPALFVARTGSDEFAIVMIGSMPTYLRFPFLETLHAELTQLAYEADPAHRVHVFMGVSQYAPSLNSPEETLLFADIALESAKRQDATRYVMFSSSMYRHYRRNRQLSVELRELLDGEDEQQLALHYQPIVCEHEATRLGAEALLRWHHPEYGFIAPPDIVELAEENGLGQRLGAWIFRRLQRDLAAFPSALVARLELSVNLSGSMFHHRLPQQVEAALAGGPLQRQQLVLELTESIAIDDLPRSQHILRGLHHIGVRVALDDFGTGWASLSYLRALSFDKLKIDRSFITAIDSDERQALFVGMITDLSHQLGVQVVAEGVERYEEWRAVLRLGVDEVQGYFYARPLPAAAFHAFCDDYFGPGLMLTEVACG